MGGRKTRDLKCGGGFIPAPKDARELTSVENSSSEYMLQENVQQYKSFGMNQGVVTCITCLKDTDTEKCQMHNKREAERA